MLIGMPISRIAVGIALAMALAVSPAFAQEMKPVRSITVTGQAQSKVVPDEAHIVINLNAQNKALAPARQAHDQKLMKLMGIIKKAGIDEKKIRTQSSTMQPVYNYTNGQRDFQGYRVQTQLDITLGDTAKLAGLIDDISAAEFEKDANLEWGNLINMYYNISNPEKLRAELLIAAAAVANAKAKAESLASASGAVLGAVYQITEGNTPQFRPMVRNAVLAAPSMGSANGAAAVAPPAGEQDIESTVTVTYEIK